MGLIKESTMSSEQSIVRFSKHQMILREGQSSSFLYLVKTGQVHLYNVENKNIVLQEVLGPGDVVNEISVIMKKSMHAFVIAANETELVKIEANEIRSAMKESPDWVENIFKTLCLRLDNTNKLIEEHRLLNQIDRTNIKMDRETELVYLKLATAQVS